MSNIEIGGVGEVADLLRVSRQRLTQLRDRPDFPEPIAVLAQGPIWNLREVRAWAGSGLRRRSAGRPSGDEMSKTLGGRFVLEERIGVGGFAAVYRAVDRKQSGPQPTIVAVKILHETASVDPEAVRRFHRELRIMDGGTSSPHVVKILGHGETGEGQVWYAMPLATGSLADRLDEFVNDPALIRDLFRQICSGLSHVHAQGIFHRDLKPANILSTGPTTWAISDFGLAVETERQTTVLTSTHRAGMGSAWYAAPEQLRNTRTADHRADIYSLGKILQELITGRPPVDNDVPPHIFRPVVQKAIDSRPEQRYQSAEEFFDAVARAVDVDAGRWQSAEDTARRLHERVRLPKPDTEDLEEVLAWASQLDENEEDDMILLTRVLPALSSGSIEYLWSRHPANLRLVVLALARRITEGSYGFEYCDVLAGFCRRLVAATQDNAILRAVVTGLTELGHNHNRWHVRDVLLQLLQNIREPEVAMVALQGLGEASADAIEWTFTGFAMRSLHPILRAGVEERLAPNS